MYEKAHLHKQEDWQHQAYKRLSIAIVERAVSDYQKALRNLKRNPDDIKAEWTKLECELFFYSSWFTTLVDLDGNALLKKLHEEFENTSEKSAKKLLGKITGKAELKGVKMS